jgi:asparagine synthetase B (glutamine-hydrolysing)
MCGFLFSNKIPNQPQLVDITPRGPDSNNTVVNHLGYFYHSRLITKESAVSQPASNSFGTLLYNGTEYVLRDNDVGFILDNISRTIPDSIEFIKKLYGDFSICWVTDDYILLARDCFGTKPLYYGVVDDYFAASSSEYAIKCLGLNPLRAEQNTLYIFNRKTLKLTHRTKIVDWDIRQGLTTIDDVHATFEGAVLERYRDGCLVPLSSGYDSGAIAACLLNIGVNFVVASYLGTENLEIIKDRFILHANKKGLFTQNNYEKKLSEIDKFSCSYYLEADTSIASVAMLTAEHANKNNINTILTGTGCDELYADYGCNGLKIRYFSQFGGKFPEDLTLVFPWHDNKSYPLFSNLPIVDYINGMHGIDSRHPFLDRLLFQTWLTSDVRVKNDSYKHWVAEYMKIYNYPYQENEKFGVNNLPLIF